MKGKQWRAGNCPVRTLESELAGRRSIGREGQAAGLADEAWKSVATTIRGGGVPPESEAVAEGATTVAFTERLLRELLPLEPGQQIANRRRMTAPGCGRLHLKRGGLLAPQFGHLDRRQKMKRCHSLAPRCHLPKEPSRFTGR